MKLFKKICLIFIFMFIALSNLILLSYFLMYKTVDMVYLGSAKGIWDSNFYPDSDECMENDFLYYNMGYAVLGDETVTRCCMSDFDFQFKKRAGKIYVYSYGCPLIKLEYNRGKFSEEGICYNKAVFAKDKFQDGIYYFYEADDVPIGNCVGNWELDPVILEEEEMDDIMLMLGIAVIIFILMSCLNMDIPIHRFAFFMLIIFILRSFFIP